MDGLWLAVMRALAEGGWMSAGSGSDDVSPQGKREGGLPPPQSARYPPTRPCVRLVCYLRAVVVSQRLNTGVCTRKRAVSEWGG